MKKETIHEHARRIPELNWRAAELARFQGVPQDQLEPWVLLLNAELIKESIDDWGPSRYDPRELHRQKTLINNFINKWKEQEVEPDGKDKSN